MEKKMATENSEMEVDGIENDSKYKYFFVQVNLCQKH